MRCADFLTLVAIPSSSGLCFSHNSEDLYINTINALRSQSLVHQVSISHRNMIVIYNKETGEMSQSLLHQVSFSRY